jgi:hypothetical protein
MIYSMILGYSKTSPALDLSSRRDFKHALGSADNLDSQMGMWLGLNLEVLTPQEEQRYANLNIQS